MAISLKHGLEVQVKQTSQIRGFREHLRHSLHDFPSRHRMVPATNTLDGSAIYYTVVRGKNAETSSDLGQGFTAP
jgi:hypothetical protein